MKKQVAQKPNMNSSEYQPALETALKLLTIPEKYELKNVRNEKQNATDVWIFRYEKSNGENNGLGGEHYSFTVDKENNKLLGFSWMDQQFARGQELPSKKRTEQISRHFYDRLQSGLADKLENLWIEPHNEMIKIGSKEVIITGMKYKCYKRDEDTYTWVIVGPNDNIIAFEQEIRWDSGRVTEKWLDDRWLIEQKRG